MATRIFRNNAQHSEDFGKLFTIDADRITKLHNVYGVWTTNADFDEDEEESDDNSRVKLFEPGEDFYVDADGRLLNSQVFSHGVSQVWYDQMPILKEDAARLPAEEWQNFGGWAEVYIYWDGHNYVVLHLADDTSHVEWEEVTDDLGADWEDSLTELIASAWNFGRREVLHTDGTKLYLERESQYAGSLDLYEDVQLDYANADEALELIKQGEEVDQVRFESGQLDEDTVLTVRGFDGTYILHEMRDKDYLQIFSSEAEARKALHERAAELFGIIADKESFDPEFDR